MKLCIVIVLFSSLQYSVYGQLCAAGYFYSFRTYCTACSPGKYNAVTTSTVYDCQKCESGKYASNNAQTACNTCSASTCDAGYYLNCGGSLAGSCVSCPSGKYAPAASMQCLTCLGGTFSSDAGSSSCTTCPAGKYTNTTGATLCIDCSAGHISGFGATYCYPLGSKTSYLQPGSSQTCEWLFYRDYREQNAFCLPENRFSLWNENNGPYSLYHLKGTPKCSSCDLDSYNGMYAGVTTSMYWAWKLFQPLTCSQCYEPISVEIPSNCASTSSPTVQQCYIHFKYYSGGCGRAEVDLGAAMCHSCNAGYYSSPPYFRRCNICPAGSYSAVVGLQDAEEAAGVAYSFSSTHSSSGCNSPLSHQPWILQGHGALALLTVAGFKLIWGVSGQ